MSLNEILKELLRSDIDFESLNISEETLNEIQLLKSRYNKPELTEQSRNLLLYLQNNYETSERFSCKEIGDKILETPRSISGSLQKIVRLGYAEKIEGRPVEYRLTEAGKSVIIDNYKNF